jgi:hypothetical protein
MELFGAALLLSALALFIVGVARHVSSQAATRWKDAVHCVAGLQIDRIDETSASGLFRERPVTLEMVQQGGYMRVEAEVDLPGDITLVKVEGNALGPRAAGFGDPDFDEAVRTVGPRAELLARLDRSSRGVVKQALVGGLTVGGGRVREAGRTADADSERIGQMLERVTEVAAALEREGRLDLCLAERALDRGELLAVRSAALGALSDYSEGPLRVLAGDPEPVLRVQAGVMLKDAAVLLAVAQDEAVPAAVRLDALEGARRLDALKVEVAEGFVVSQLESSHAVRAIALLGGVGTLDSVPLLTGLERGQPTPTQRAATQAILAIQGRLVGGVSIAESSGGAVSVHQDQEGAVSHPAPSRPRRTQTE